MPKQLEKVDHQLIRYANCWEDAEVLMQALKPAEGDRVLSIGSAGDNSFAFLAFNPEIVVAVDINPVQLKLIELKKAAIKHLDHEEFLSFLGFKNNAASLEIWQKLRPQLHQDLADFWQERTADIQQGLIHSGKFEKYFQLFKNKVLPLCQSGKNVEQLFLEKSDSQQKEFFQKKWNNWRWRSLFKLFFSKTVMGKIGRDPAFLKEVNFSVSRFILDKSQQHLSNSIAQQNYFLNYIMKGDFGDQLPFYARAEIFQKIKQNIDKLECYEGLAESAMKKYPNCNKFNLSNIFEYMSADIFQEVSNQFMKGSSNQSVFAYWNLMVPRNMAEIQENLHQPLELVEKLRAVDKGFFYAGIQINQKV